VVLLACSGKGYCHFAINVQKHPSRTVSSRYDYSSNVDWSFAIRTTHRHFLLSFSHPKCQINPEYVTFVDVNVVKEISRHQSPLQFRRTKAT
jgi:hypothetical protein